MINALQKGLLAKCFPLLLFGLLPLVLSAQTNVLKGTVVSDDGAPLEGATVQWKNTDVSVKTDAEGNFSIPYQGGKQILLVSFIGYISTEKEIQSNTHAGIRLLRDKNELSEVVVVAYGQVRKSDLTGSVVSIKSDELKAIPTTSIDQALQGRAAGVEVTQMSGKPGAETSIRIRGTSSITAGNEPLYVVDGLLISSDGGDVSAGGTRGPRISPLASINPADIESIEILKDASATAMYGSRGTNGVVLITTKRGKTGKGLIQLDASQTFQTLARKVEVLNASDFGYLVNEGKRNVNQTPIYVNPANLGEGTDWQDALYRQAMMGNYQVNFSAGDEKTKFNISGGYFDQEGIVLNSDFKRYSFRTNVERAISDRVTVGTSLSYSNINTKGVLTNAGDIVPGVTYSALLFNPIQSILDPTHRSGYTFENDRGKVLGNPIAEAREYTSVTKLNRLMGNAFLQVKLSNDLSFRSSFGIDYFSNEENSFGPNYLKRTEASNGEASLGKTIGSTWLNENTLSYNKSFDNDHRINAVVGFTAQRFQNEKLLVYAFDFPDNRTGYHDIYSALKPQRPRNFESSWSMLSYLGRVNYTIKDKYLFTLTGRVDGSSKFAAGNQYGFFPSGAFAWRISEEDFMLDQSTINDLKFRVSYGIIGNQAIPPYQSLALVGPYGEGAFNTGSGPEIYTGKEPLSYVYRKIRWETTHQLDIGLDLSLFNNRISFTADYYNKKTNDLLLSTPIPLTSGFANTMLNIGNIDNWGLEFDLRTINVQRKLTWTSALNFSMNRNTISKLNSETDVILNNVVLLREGVSIGTFYGYQFMGIFQTDEEAASNPVLVGQEPTSSNVASRAKAGDRQYRDLNGDGKIDENDRTVLGTAVPKFTIGFTNTLQYKNFDLSIFLHGSYGNKLANFNNLDLLNFNGQNNVLKEAALNRWTPTNPSNKYPRAMATGNVDQGIISDVIVEDASFLRVRNITLAYHVPSHWLKKANIQQLKLFLSGSNLFTFTKYTGFDPEANTFGQSTTLLGIDLGGYPQARMLQIGLNASF
ncbi:SusC/RagA family TonB-linked outer membrane protein [Gynurincola endophyticus]|uniref:SusC/RagA family TonB-linked outer membrane protein n=1 Tax=Gynurincola endophyticus TaxID=2479004 RepID=UPI000F8DAF82|nr:TonB-dependent receptor [Gynurincola endophyticus]